VNLDVSRRVLVVAALLGIAAAAAVVAFLVARPSSSAQWGDPGGLDGFSEDRLTIHPAEGGHDQRWMSFEELHTKFPGSIELPSVMPASYQLFFIDLLESGHRSNPSPENWLSARYVIDDANAEIRFNQSRGDNLGTFEGAEEVRVHGGSGLYGTRTEPAQYDRLWWQRCGRTFELQSIPARGTLEG
jgi:hypothetical protein